MVARTFDPTERQGVDAVAKALSGMGLIWREQPIVDFGIDGHIELVDEETRKPNGQLIGVQIKSGPSFFAKASDGVVPFYISQDHWDYWSTHALPIIVVLHDDEMGRTIWQWVTPETTVQTGKMRRLDIPLRQTLEKWHREKLGYRGPLGSSAARRQRFALDIGIIRALQDQPEIFVSFAMWVNKSLSFRGAEIRFGDPHKAQPDLAFPWMSTRSDVNEIAWVLFPWLSLDEYYSLENHAGEVDEHILRCSLNDAARAFLTIEDFFDTVTAAPPLPDPPDEGEDYGDFE
ncbi:MAG: DUF4365 domain-containing protein [Myxococcota bacterium]